MKNPNGKFGDPKRSPQEARISKEEMNIAEYPITLLSGTVPKGIKKIEYTDWITSGGKQKRLRWVVSGSEDHGLPIGGDQDIYVAIMETWREQGLPILMNPVTHSEGIRPAVPIHCGHPVGAKRRWGFLIFYRSLSFRQVCVSFASILL